MGFRVGTWDLPDGIEVIGFDKSNWKIKSNPISKAFSHGAFDSADGKFDGKQIVLSVRIVGNSETEYRKLEDDFYSHVYQENIKIYPEQNRYVNVKRIVNLVHKWVSNVSYLTASEISVTFFCEDPFWYLGSVSQSYAISSSPYDFTIFNIGTVEVFPLFTITAAAANASMSLKNVTDNRLFNYVDVNFTTNDTLIIDTNLGTVQRNGVNSIKYFQGAFLRLLHGANAFEYVGANCTIKIDFVNRYLG